jgi:hypothetical protein
MKDYDREFVRTMKIFRKYWYYYLFGIIIVVIFFIVGGKLMDKHWQKIYQEYPSVNRNQALNDCIIDVFSSRGFSYVLTKDSAKYSLSANENPDYEDYYLMDFLHEGDSLVKRRNSDTLYIYRDNEKYHFILEFYNQEK